MTHTDRSGSFSRTMSRLSLAFSVSDFVGVHAAQILSPPDLRLHWLVPHTIQC